MLYLPFMSGNVVQANRLSLLVIHMAEETFILLCVNFRKFWSSCGEALITHVIVRSTFVRNSKIPT